MWFSLGRTTNHQFGWSLNYLGVLIFKAKVTCIKYMYVHVFAYVYLGLMFAFGIRYALRVDFSGT